MFENILMKLNIYTPSKIIYKVSIIFNNVFSKPGAI